MAQMNFPGNFEGILSGMTCLSLQTRWLFLSSYFAMDVPFSADEFALSDSRADSRIIST